MSTRKPPATLESSGVVSSRISAVWSCAAMLISISTGCLMRLPTYEQSDAYSRAHGCARHPFEWLRGFVANSSSRDNGGREGCSRDTLIHVHLWSHAILGTVARWSG